MEWLGKLGLSLPQAGVGSVGGKQEPLEKRVVEGCEFAFWNGHMLSGIYKNQMVLHVSQEDADILLQIKGTVQFEPKPGQVFERVVVLPEHFWQNVVFLNEWASKALAYVSGLPAVRR
jgi:hypothetical protein